MASNYGVPPPPPPPRSNGFQGSNGVGSLCPPPPPPPPQSQSIPQYHQPVHHQTMQHRGYQQQHLNNAPANYQYHQQQYPPQGQPAYQYQYPQQQQQPQMHQQQHQYQQNQYSSYSNYASAPPPPPPPHSPFPSHQGINHGNNMQTSNNPNQNNGHNAHNHKANTDAAASLRDSLPGTNSNISTKNDTPKTKPDKPKKINPKMAKKYAGKGLKTIAVSGPGMPTQRFKICVGNYPEDIKKWIEERKKRFPRMDGSGGSARAKRGREGEGKQENKDAKRSCVDEKAKSDGASKDEGGLSSLLAGYDSSSSKEEASKSKDTAKDESASAAVPSSNNGDDPANQNTNPQPKRVCKYFQRGKCHHGTNCKFLHTEAAAKESNTKKRQSQSDRDKLRNQYRQELQVLGLATPGHGSKYTTGGKVINNTSLLAKLLQRDKERERHLALQLLRYIVDCDYFQGGGDGTAIVGKTSESGVGVEEEEEEEEEEEGEVKDDDTAKQS